MCRWCSFLSHLWVNCGPLLLLYTFNRSVMALRKFSARRQKKKNDVRVKIFCLVRKYDLKFESYCISFASWYSSCSNRINYIHNQKLCCYCISFVSWYSSYSNRINPPACHPMCLYQLDNKQNQPFQPSQSLTDTQFYLLTNMFCGRKSP